MPQVLIIVLALVGLSRPALADHPALDTEAPANGVCLECHDMTLAAPAVQHRAMEAGCIACHDIARQKDAPFLRLPVNELCLSCHRLPSMPNGAPPRAVSIGPGFSFDPKLLPARRINLDSRGAGHPIANHPVAGRPDPAHPGRDLNCVSCHVPHATESPRLLAFALKPGQGVCQKCHEL